MADISKIRMADNNQEFYIKDATAVKFVEQDLEEDEKRIARENIDATCIKWKSI